MFDPVYLQLILGIQGVLQAVIASALWMLAFYRLRFGVAGFCMALLPFFGLFASTLVIAFGTFIFGAAIDPTLLYSVAPSFVGFIFAAAPLVFLVMRLKKTRPANVFE